MALEMSHPTGTNNDEPRNINSLLKTKNKVSSKDRIFFVEQLILMLETGSDLHTSLKVLAKQSDNAAVSKLIAMLGDDIGQGKTFSWALSRHPHVFSQTYVSLIAASEGGGYLRRILEHLLEMEKQREELKSTLISAISYPVFLLLFSFGMVVFILAVVFPKFGNLFISIQDQLPVTTIILMALSQIITHHWWEISLGFLAILLMLIFWVKSEAGSEVIDRLKIKTPVLKSIYIKVYLIQTMRMLALSLKNGVNLVEALTLVKGVVNNRGFNEFLDGVLKDVVEGRSFAHGFNTTEFIPPIVGQMVSTGEQTGKLALVCDRIGDYYQRDIEKLLKLLAKAIEPILLLVMGVIVGVLVSSLILPIFKLSHAVH